MRRVRARIATSAAVALTMAVTGCASTTGTPLGKSMTISPGWSRILQRSKRAARDPAVWGPLVAAALLQIDDFDHRISDRLRDDAPLFGSASAADDASSDLRDLTMMAYVSTAIAAPGPEKGTEWLGTKAGLLGAEWLTVELAELTALELEDLGQRDRPNHEARTSFPSAHATIAATQAQLTSLNLEYLPIDDMTQWGLGLTVDGLAALTGWARVEAGKHYPSDVLVGWSLGNYFGQLSTEFIAPGQEQISINPVLGDEQLGFELNVQF